MTTSSQPRFSVSTSSSRARGSQTPRQSKPTPSHSSEPVKKSLLLRVLPHLFSQREVRLSENSHHHRPENKTPEEEKTSTASFLLLLRQIKGRKTLLLQVHLCLLCTTLIKLAKLFIRPQRSNRPLHTEMEREREKEEEQVYFPLNCQSQPLSCFCSR